MSKTLWWTRKVSDSKRGQSVTDLRGKPTKQKRIGVVPAFGGFS